MYKYNNGNGAILCDVCRIIIQSPAKESRIVEHDLCSDCQVKVDYVKKVLEDYNEMIDTLKKED